MACVVCEHCSGHVDIEDRVICKGYSYHKGCTKCHFCSETNLEDAEIFKGVIFCSNCSNRIFHTANSDVPMKNKHKRYKNLYELTTEAHKGNDIIMLAKAGAITGDTPSLPFRENTKSNPIPMPRSSVMKYRRRKMASRHCASLMNLYYTTEWYKVHVMTLELKKCIADTGMSTETTQDISKDIELPIITFNQKLAPSRLPPKYTKYRKSKSNNVSDMRIAELGTSTEIANMALRKKSDDEAVIIKSMAPLKRTASSILSALKIGTSCDEDESGADETFTTTTKSEKKHWMDRRIRSMVKLPYKNFKKKILRRSSIVSALMSVEEEPENLVKKIKALFQTDITQHQRRGLKRLYSTINRRNSPRKLGWLHLMHKTEGDISCRHVEMSHSYRCMRAQVMRIAGPTKSELALYRSKILDLIVHTAHIKCKNKKRTMSLSSPTVVDTIA